LVSALERAALITEERVAGNVRAHVKIEVSGDLLKISTISAIGSTYEELAIEHSGNDLVIAFNNRFLIDSVRACDAEKVTMSLSSPLTSMNITPEANSYDENGVEELFMLLPVRTKD
jgi:DNA polymerase-3 subunit beta